MLRWAQPARIGCEVRRLVKVVHWGVPSSLVPVRTLVSPVHVPVRKLSWVRSSPSQRLWMSSPWSQAVLIGSAAASRRVPSMEKVGWVQVVPLSVLWLPSQR